MSEQQGVEDAEEYRGRPAGRHVCVPDEEHCDHVDPGPPPLALEEE